MPAGCEGLFFHPYLMGERSPYWDTKLRASFIGATAHHGRGHFNRAVLEGVAFSIKDNFSLIENTVPIHEVRIVGGGGKSPLWRQMLADVFDCPVATTVSTEGPALGAAILAGVGAGLYPSVEEACREMIHVNPAQQPIPENVPEYAKYYAVYQKLYAANRDIFKELGKIS